MSYLSRNSPISDPQNFCWRPDSIRPYESLWSIFRKLAQLNATTASGVMELLRSGGVIDSLRKTPKLDLLRCGSINQEQLAHFLQLESDRIYQACALAYLKPKEITSLASKYLRYCHSCLRADFHSPLHQFLFLSRCPIHPEELLTDHCEACNSFPVVYGMSSVGDKTSLGGECCLKASGREGKRLTEKNQKKLGAIAKLLVDRCQMETIDQPIERWLGPETAVAKGGLKLLNLVRYWQDLCSSSQAKNTRYGRNSALTPHPAHIAIRSQSIGTTKDVEYSAVAHQPLFLVYKSIYRHVLTTHLRSHRSCFAYLIGRLSTDCSLGMNRGQICAPAQAFIMWRMFFENAHTPNQLTNGYRGRRSHAMIYWHGTSFAFPGQALHRIFALESLALFNECLLLAERDYQSQIFSFNTNRITEGQLPYWSIQRNNDGSVVIHWWPRSVAREVVTPLTSAAKIPERKSCCFTPSKWNEFL